MDAGLQAVFRSLGNWRGRGGQSELARLLGINRQAISKWRRVPDHWIVKIERLTKVPREKLRPDLYRKNGG